MARDRPESEGRRVSERVPGLRFSSGVRVLLGPRRFGRMRRSTIAAVVIVFALAGKRFVGLVT